MTIAIRGRHWEEEEGWLHLENIQCPLILAFPNIVSAVWQGIVPETGQEKTTATCSEDNHFCGPKRRWLLFNHPWPWRIQCESVPERAMCKTPPDLLIGKVLAATTHFVDLAICLRCGVAMLKADWQTTWWPANYLNSEEDLQVQHRPRETVAVSWNIVLVQWVFPMPMECGGNQAHRWTSWGALWIEQNAVREPSMILAFLLFVTQRQDSC